MIDAVPRLTELAFEILSLDQLPSNLLNPHAGDMDRAEQRKVVLEYVAALLRQECNEWGRARQIATHTGYTPGHLSHVLRGKKMMGGRFARAVAEFFALDWDALERSAPELKKLLRRRGPLPTVKQLAVEATPNLRDALAFVQPEFPREYLEAFEATARAAGRDRPRTAWVDAVKAEYWTWKGSRKSLQKKLPIQSRVERYPREQSKEEPSGEFPMGHHKRKRQEPKKSKRTAS